MEDGERSQLENLRWLGIDWDESPETHEQYRQSERLDIYQKYVDELLASGKAYKSYVTEEELAAGVSVRKLQAKHLATSTNTWVCLKMKNGLHRRA